MRPTGIGYRSPREKTPAYYTIHVSILELKEELTNPKYYDV